MLVRRATSDDADAIADIWNAMIRNTLFTFTTQPKDPGDLARSIDSAASERRGWFVAVAADRVVGFATYAQFRGGPGYAHTVEHSVVLDPAARGSGAGRALIEAVVADATAHGHHSLVGGISSANPDGLAFHLAVGFTHVATLPEVGFKNGQWLDLVLVQRKL